MSVVMCERCDSHIDSDDDPECFVEAPDYMPATFLKNYGTQILCEPCREAQAERELEGA